MITGHFIMCGKTFRLTSLSSELLCRALIPAYQQRTTLGQRVCDQLALGVEVFAFLAEG